MIFSVHPGRVKGMSVATDNFARSVLSGVISTVGYVPNAIVKSQVGRKFFKTGPGEVALASLVSFCMYQTSQQTFCLNSSLFLLFLLSRYDSILC